METYKIIRKSGYVVGIKCLVCGRTSYNENDIKYKYCGHCHEFHDMLQRYGGKTPKIPVKIRNGKFLKGN